MTDPRFSVTDDGFRDALGRSRRRRARRRVATASASGGLLSLVAVVALLGGAGTPDSLRQQEQLGPAGAPTAAGTPEPPSLSTPRGSAAPVGTTSQPDAPAAPPQPAASAGSVPTGPGPQPAPVPTTASAPQISGPAVLSTTAYRSSSPCADTSGRATTGWCLQPGDTVEGVSGTPVDLAVSLCRLPGFPAADATFPSTAEAGFGVEGLQGGGSHWEHARQHPGRAGRHTRTVQPGQCLTWTATWWNRDDAGADLPPGGYSLRLTVLTEDVGGPQGVLTQTYRYDVRGR